MPLALDQLRRDLAPIVRAIIADVERRVTPDVVVARGVQRLLIVIEGDERPAERIRRENDAALREMRRVATPATLRDRSQTSGPATLTRVKF
jgi:hypothetical protein